MNSKSAGKIFNIQRMSLHDGPGIRTTVFFKGCSLNCFWCHNPESMISSTEIQFLPNTCINCKLCRNVCEMACHSFNDKNSTHIFNRENCTRCGQCADVCPTSSLRKIGYEIEIDALISEVLHDKPFYDQSGGGVTVSGGEPLLQSDFVSEFFRRLKFNSIHTAIETALNVPTENLKEVLPYTDLLLVDMKHPNPMMHKQFTGADHSLIIKNFDVLEQSNVDYLIRIPIIPGINDSIELMTEFEKLMYPLKRALYVELMPYHDWGISKYVSLSKDASKQTGMCTPSKEQLIHLAKQFKLKKVLFRDGSKNITIWGGKICKLNQTEN